MTIVFAGNSGYAGVDRVEKEIPFEEFHDWLIEQLAAQRSFV